MARTVLVWITPEEASFRIEELSKRFTPNNYVSAFIGSKAATVGTTIGDYKGLIFGTEGPDETADNQVTIFCSGMDTYTGGSFVYFYGITAAASDEKLYNAGSIRVRVPTKASSAPGAFTLSVTPRDCYAELSWDHATGRYYYEIYVDDVYFGATTDSTYFVEDLFDSTSYKFTVVAINEHGETIRTVTKSTTKPMPEPPEYISSSVVNSNSIRVDYVKGSDAQYTELYWNTTGSDPTYGSGYDIRTTNSSTITVSGLPYNAGVYFWIRSSNSLSSVSEWVYCGYLETGSPPPPTAPIIDSRFDGGLNMSWSSIIGASTYTFEYKPSYLSTWTPVTTSNNFCTIAGLSHAVKYDFRVRSDLNSTYSTVSSGHTLPKRPTISATNITHSSVTIRVDALPDNCDKVKIESYIYSNGNYVYDSMQFIDPPGRTFPTAQTATFTGLYRGWSYRFFAYSAYDANGDGTGTGTWLESEYSNEITVSTLNRPDNWAWVTSFYSGMEFTIYNIGITNYYYIMPAAEWNSFLAKINEFRAYKNLSTVSFPIYTRDVDFTAAVYNLAVNAINAMSAYFVGYTAIPTKSSGAELTANDFFRLRNTLNSIE